MNDTPSTPSPVTTGSPSISSISAGQLLRQYRESVGLHIVALSSALKVARAKIEALEADRLDELPDVVFARALAMSCCRYLGRDAEPVLALMPGHAAQPTPALRQNLPAQEEVAQRPRFVPSRGPFGNQAMPSWAVWVLVLLVIVVGGWFAAAPQRPVVKPPAAALDFPPQGVPGAEPVNGAVESVTPGIATQAPAAVSSAPNAAVPAAAVTPGTSHPGNVNLVPAPSANTATSPVRVEPVAPTRP